MEWSNCVCIYFKVEKILLFSISEQGRMKIQNKLVKAT